MIATTLRRIHACHPCAPGWKKLLKHLGKAKPDDERLPFAIILELNGIDDALWCCRVEPQYAKEWRLLAVAFARRVQHLMTDTRSVAALDVAERHAVGAASDDELHAAMDAARGAAKSAASVAAKSAARSAASVAASVAAWDSPSAAGWISARASARAAAWDAERAWQSAEFLRVVTETEARS